VGTSIQVLATVDENAADAQQPQRRAHPLLFTLLTLFTVVLFGTGFTYLAAKQIAAADQIIPRLLAPRPQPDHLVLGFAAESAQDVSLYVTAAQAQQNLKITGWSPVWSPDGTQLVFISDQGGTPQLYMTASGGEAPLQLTNVDEPIYAPAWSPDGSKLSFITGQLGMGKLQILDSRRLRWGNTALSFMEHEQLIVTVNKLFDNRQFGAPAGVTGQSAWAPDGHSLIFDYYQADKTRILQVHSDGTLTVLAEDSWAPAWSPTGEEIVAVSAEGVFRLPTAGGARRYLSARQAKAPAWSSHGQQIAYLVPQETKGRVDHEQPSVFDLWVIDATGDNETLLSPNCITFAWAPDGARLAYVTGNQQQSTGNLYLWTQRLGSDPVLQAEVTRPEIAWAPRAAHY
jgi:Tol biopolymer transport system component